MQLVKFKNSLNAWMFVSCLGVLLSACDGDLSAQSSTSSILLPVDDPHDAQVWLAKQAQHAQNTDNTNSSLQVTDHRLLHVIGPITDKVFISLNDAVTGNSKSRNAEIGQSDTSVFGSLESNGRGMDNRFASIGFGSEAQTELELAQASVSQIKFLGVMQNQHELFGLVQVGERVYRVKQHESIGAGKWQVISIDEARMQLKVNGKVVTYDK